MVVTRGITLLGILLTLISSYRASPVPESSVASSNVARLPIRRAGIGNTETATQRRSVDVSLRNNKVTYLVDVQIGTPPQPMTLILDTGSSEVWVFALSACNDCLGGTYVPSTSSSSASVNDLGSFSQKYVDGSGVSGYYVTDTVSFNTSSITDVYLGVATSNVGNTNSYGIMGIGFDGLETSSVKHPGILDDLLKQGIITSNSYSIYLDDIDASTGSIIFGGVDNSKFSGDLVSLPIIQNAPGDTAPRLQVSWTYLSLTDASGTTTTLSASDLSYPVGMDTGYTTTVLPVDIFNQLYSYFNAQGPDSGGNYYVQCPLPNGHLTYGFGAGPAVTIQVPFSELGVPLTNGQCLFGFIPQDGAVVSFGDTFMRSAYVNFDFGQNMIGLAQSVRL